MLDMTGVHQHLVADLVDGVRLVMFVGLSCLAMFGQEKVVSGLALIELHMLSCHFPFIIRGDHELQGISNFHWGVSHQGRDMRKMLAKDQLSRNVLGGNLDMVVESEGNTLQVISPGVPTDVSEGAERLNDRFVGLFRDAISLGVVGS